MRCRIFISCVREAVLRIRRVGAAFGFPMSSSFKKIRLRVPEVDLSLDSNLRTPTSKPSSIFWATLHPKKPPNPESKNLNP